MLAITFQSSLTFAGNTRSLPKKEKALQLGWLWPCPQIKTLVGVSKDKTSSLLGLVISDEGKTFYNIDSSPSSLTMRPNNLEGLSLETLSSQVLEFEGKARANPIGGPFRCFLLGQAPGATSKC